MTRFFALAFVALIAAHPALADPNLENQLIAASAKAVRKMLSGDAVAARAECEAGKALLTVKTPKFLTAHIEGCFALTAAPAGSGNEKLGCPHYSRAIEIWRSTPPPMDDEDAAIKRAGILKQWKSSSAKTCGTPVETARADLGPIIGSIAPGSRLQTQEGISYLIPEGWTVKSFNETLGFATLTHAKRNTDLYVQRESLNHKYSYPDKATLASGRVLEWEHRKFLLTSGVYVMYGRIKLADAYVRLYMHADGGVDKDFGLETMQKIADSAKIEGKRACIGNCGPGKIKSPD